MNIVASDNDLFILNYPLFLSIIPNVSNLTQN